LNKGKIRVQLDLLPHEAEALDRLRDQCNLRSRADAVRTALAVLEWAQKEARKGRRILSIGDDEVVPLMIPGLTILFEDEAG
jgi:hypothetical protein